MPVSRFLLAEHTSDEARESESMPYKYGNTAIRYFFKGATESEHGSIPAAESAGKWDKGIQS
jgi:hypothetical protein